MSDEPKSKYSVLRIPEFKSTIPDHFLAKLSDQERYLVQTLSKMEQENAWLVEAITTGNGANIDLDVRVQVIEQWKERLTSKWTLVLGGAALIAPLILKELVDLITRHRAP